MAEGPAGRLLRDRDGAPARVGAAELFFDLVFVFAVTQLSHTLLAHPTPLGLVQVAMLFLATWWAWMFTTWYTNWLDPERTMVRWLLFALMAAGLVVSMSIPQAFAGRGATFAIAFVALQLGRSLFMLWATRHDAKLSRNFQRIAAWLSISALFWLWGGFAAPGERLLLWGIALAIEYAAPALRFPVPFLGSAETADWEIDGSHMAERCGLFVIVALGESILITGATFAGQPWRDAAIAAFVSAFLGTIAMWWIYFNVGAKRGARRLEDESDPGALARSAYTYLHIPIVAGIVLTAASDEIALAHPHGALAPLHAAFLIGGPALYLVGNGLFKRATAGWFPLSHWIGLALSAALAIAAALLRLDALALSLGSTAILLLVAIWETRSLNRGAAAEEPEASAR